MGKSLMSMSIVTGWLSHQGLSLDHLGQDTQLQSMLTSGYTPQPSIASCVLLSQLL